MKRIALAFPLLLCSCAASLQNAAGAGGTPPLAGIVAPIGRYDRQASVGSVWIDRYRNIYLTDRNRWRVLSYQWNGDSCVFRYEVSLRDPGSFLVPGYDQGFCLADNLNQRLVYCSFQGAETGRMSLAGRTASAAAISLVGDVFVLDGPQRTLAVYDSRGSLLRQFALAGGPEAADYRPAIMAVTRAGDMIAVADPDLGLIRLYTAFGRRLGGFRRKSASLAFDSFNRLWSLDKDGRIGVFAHRGRSGESLWPDTARAIGEAGAIAAGAGGAAIIAGDGNVFLCK
ncbi:MAG: hypothetical protein QME74_00515 [Candidatus Edwardsbacteria bacterium]|nr:hypothetical protein [Candidatus Edwardsbacteria bacterium]